MRPSFYDSIIGHYYRSVEKRDESQTISKGKRPLKMPKDYDFSVRNVDWGSYKNDFLLRTDAVWEKSKLYDMFYVLYKHQLIYDKVNNQYNVADIRMMPMPTNEPEHLEDARPFMGYTDQDGCVWQFKIAPMLQRPTSLSKFIADKEGDSWYLCFMTF